MSKRHTPDEMLKNGLRFRHESYWFGPDKNGVPVVTATIWTLVEVLDITNPEAPIAEPAE